MKKITGLFLTLVMLLGFSAVNVSAATCDCGCGNSSTYPYTFEFTSDYYEIDLWYPGELVEAHVMDEQGNILTAPKVVSIVYTVKNCLGEIGVVYNPVDIFRYCVWGGDANVYAEATLQDGTVLHASTFVLTPAIQPK